MTEATRRPRQRLSDEIRDSIVRDLLLTDEVRPGERLPTEADLSDRYRASRVTVRSALRSLQEAGLITIRQGRGSTVLPRKHALESGLDRLSSLESLAAGQGSTVSSEQLEIVHRGLDEGEAERLARERGTDALVIRRVKVYGMDRVGWIEDYVPEGVLPFATLRNEFAGSVLDVLLGHPELDVQYSDCEVTAVGLPADIAARLDIDTGSPTIFLDELTRTGFGAIVNWSRAWLLPQYFTLNVRRNRRFL